MVNSGFVIFFGESCFGMIIYKWVSYCFYEVGSFTESVVSILMREGL